MKKSFCGEQQKDQERNYCATRSSTIGWTVITEFHTTANANYASNINDGTNWLQRSTRANQLKNFDFCFFIC